MSSLSNGKTAIDINLIKRIRKMNYDTLDNIIYVLVNYYDKIRTKKFTIFDYCSLDWRKRCTVNAILKLLGYRSFSQLTTNEFKEYLKQHGIPTHLTRSINKLRSRSSRDAYAYKHVQKYQDVIHNWIYKEEVTSNGYSDSSRH